MEKVDILLSVYKPNKKYLIEQLKSLNDQNYPILKSLLTMIAQNFHVIMRYLSPI